MSNKCISSDVGISVIMPTYNQACFIRNAIRSLLIQTYTKWELIIVNDGSTDNTLSFIEDYLKDSRIIYRQNTHNMGIGYSINVALSMAKYDYIAYLPSDDFYYSNHLELIMKQFKNNKNVVLVTTGVKCEIKDSLVCQERLIVNGMPAKLWNQLVQTAHKKNEERWVERCDWVSEDLYKSFWNKLTTRGSFVHCNTITCQWTIHPYQRYKIISEEYGGNINRYRSYYNVKTPIKIRVSEHKFIDEEQQYAQFRIKAEYKNNKNKALKILLVGDLSYNPERILALEEAGHKLYGLWTPSPMYSFSNVGPLPFGNVTDLKYDNWEEEVRRVRPDIIYGLLNSCSVPFAHEVLMKFRDIPFVWHFKEGPFLCLAKGTWKQLIELYTLADGVIFLNNELKTWYEQYIPKRQLFMILDGDLPKKEYFKYNFSPKLSESDREIHTVIPGRMVGLSLSDIKALSFNKIHVHLYTESYESKWNQKIAEFLKASPDYFHVHHHCDAFNWANEFSKYDAGWLHQIESHNNGCINLANWNDMNMPARLSTMMVAGIPCIQKDNTGHIVAMQSCLKKNSCGLFYTSIYDLSEQLKNKEKMTKLQQQVLKNRIDFSFDSHVPELIAFFKTVIENKK